MKYLLPVVCSVFLIGCGDSAQTEAPLAQPAQAEAAVDQASEMATEVAGAETVAPETPAEAPVAETKPAPAPSKAATPVTAAATTAASSAAAAATTAVASTTAAVKTAAAAVDGTVVFAQKCASCHGMKAEKAALGKSQVIAGWNEQQTKDALKGYQAGTYGKEMKTLMQGQAKALSDAQIDALAKHISKL